jgi:hypothetical protein
MWTVADKTDDVKEKATALSLVKEVYQLRLELFGSQATNLLDLQ